MGFSFDDDEGDEGDEGDDVGDGDAIDKLSRRLGRGRTSFFHLAFFRRIF